MKMTAMLAKHILLAALGLLIQLGAAQGACTTAGAHFIVARASTEPPGTGIIGVIARRAARQLAGSDVVAVDYPAELSSLAVYIESETQGVVEMTRLVNEYAVACPASKIVIMGYSQVSSNW